MTDMGFHEDPPVQEAHEFSNGGLPVPSNRDVNFVINGVDLSHIVSGVDMGPTHQEISEALASLPDASMVIDLETLGPPAAPERLTYDDMVRAIGDLPADAVFIDPDTMPVPEPAQPLYTAPEPVTVTCPICGNEPVEIMTNGQMSGHLVPRRPGETGPSWWAPSCEAGGWTPEEAVSMVQERKGRPGKYVRPHP